MINRKKFFEAITPVPLPRPRTQGQVNTIDAVLDEAERRQVTDNRYIADVLGTIMGEVGIKMVPVREGFKATDAEARVYVNGLYRRGKIKMDYSKPGSYGNSFYGRGDVQITHESNYAALTKIAQAQGFKVDFVKDPDLLLDPKWAVWAAWEGMLQGTFRKGNKLSTFYNSKITDFVGSRGIINHPSDRAAEIGGYKKNFFTDLTIASA